MPDNRIEAAADAAQRLHAAHAAMRADPAVQFALAPVQPPAPPPAWLTALAHWLRDLLRPIGRALSWIGRWLPDAPYARTLLWIVIAATIAVIAWMAVERLRHGEWRLPRRSRNVAEAVEQEPWQPDAAPVRAWLQEADALAAQDRFAEAAHCLLVRSVEDIARRRPKLMRPALTAREIARAPAVPTGARDLFAGIAGLVERSLFGGRPVAQADWLAARTAYADFAMPKTWRE